MSEYLQYGGQAVVEGVMMRSPRYFAVACRKPDGSIIVQAEPIEKSIVGRLKWLNRPFLRGTLALIDAMALGTKALVFAANVQTEGIRQTGKRPVEDISSASPRPGSRINDIGVGAAMVGAFCFGLLLFVALPTLLTQLTQRHLGIPMHTALPYRQQVMLNVSDGLIRITIFLGYIGLISRMENIRRVFQYHGAEHKAINTLEAGETLSAENAQRASRIHPRCGTSFLIVVLLAGILVHSLFPRPENYLLRLALHLSLIPIVAGFAYEIIRLAGKFRNTAAVRILLAPGLWSQYLTTREPAVDQIEVALAALHAVLDRERETSEPSAIESPSAAVA